MFGFSRATKDSLGYYVYGLVDPRTERIFYVGKASANDRAFNHLVASKAESKKQLWIDDIRSSNHEPIVEILRYGLESEDVAFEVEAAVIDAIGLENLTNVVRGHGIIRGRIHASEIERLHGANPVLISSVKEPCILFFVQNTFSPTLTKLELYDRVRQFWHDISENNRNISNRPVALAVVDGVVVSAYRIAAWFPAGTTLSSRNFSGKEDRWEFVGHPIDNHFLVGRMLVEDDGITAIKAIQKGYRYLPILN